MCVLVCAGVGAALRAFREGVLAIRFIQDKATLMIASLKLVNIILYR